LRAARRSGSELCLADASGGTALSGYRTIAAAVAFSRLMRRLTPEPNLGLLVPTSSAGTLANMAALLAGKTVVNLNYTANLAALEAAVDKAQIRGIFTSRQFLQRLQRRGIDLSPLLDHVTVHHLEDLGETLGLAKKLSLLLAARLLPARLLYGLFGRARAIDDPAAILFSSGTEGVPKGVVLSHRNIMGNIQQVSDVLDTREGDAVMATLPLFHAFGLTVTCLLPLVEGIPAVCHPDPTDAPAIAKGVARFNATLLCATSTFLRLFVRNSRVHPLMLEPLRLVVAGAERLSPEVRDAFKLKFNKEVYEGYGTTETTPVAGVNLPDRIAPTDWVVQRGNKPGTVGMPLPGSSFRIVDPDTLLRLPVGQDGLVLIGGTQVMIGYLDDPQRTAEAIVELDGRRWYRSGDKGHLDADGFLTIVDRYSRFAKIGGEMISLGAIESALGRSLPEPVEILATAVPDGKKGEKVVLLVAGDIEEEEVRRCIEDSELNPLMRPAQIIPVPAIPKLGSGKSDLAQARRIALGEADR
jgi:acyl-[acyl-carrier-protein]-phospholipid O-acyltransferase/long-chain-fatty-acid--[acyl-carrier-protein] ligase